MNLWTKDPAVLQDKTVVDGFLEHFRMLAAVPRPSKHEQAVCAVLKAWAERLGIEVKRNAERKLVFDVPATEGLEHLPLLALQAHLDMVCVARDGRPYDPLRDPVLPVVDRAAGTLRADGTSLGADDGAGVAIIMGIAEGKMAHGPLRVLFTTDEEVGMTGALAVTAEDLRGVKYMVNIDSEESDAVTVSSAADAELYATSAVAVAVPSKKTALEIVLSELSGGHSGLEIGTGKCNAVVALAETLKCIGCEVDFELASFAGGTAKNAIPAKARAVVLIDPPDRTKTEKIIAAREAGLKAVHADSDPGLSLRIADTPSPETVMADADATRLLDYVTGSINGVHTMSPSIDGLVESSSNLGRVEAGPERIWCLQMARSSDASKLREIEEYQTALAAECTLEMEIIPGSRGWPVNPDSVLVPRLREIYRNLTGREMRAVALHAGLECGIFAELDGGIDMASIGPDIAFAHSPDETLRLDSVPLVWRLLERLLSNLD